MSETRLSSLLLSLLGAEGLVRLAERRGGTRLYVPAEGNGQLAADIGAAAAGRLADRRATWRRLIARMFGGRPPGARRVPAGTYEDAMRALYGAAHVPPAAEPPCTRESRPEYGEWH